MAGAAALALALLLPGPVAAVDDLPDLGAVAIRLEDLPPGFATADESGARMVDLFDSMAGAFTTSPDAELRSVAAFQRRIDGGSEYAISFLIAPLTADDRRGVDAAFTEIDLVREQIREAFGDMDVTLLEGFPVGETRLGLRIADADLGVVFELVEARRGAVLSLAGHVLQGDADATVTLDAIARTLDGRLAAVVGSGAPVFRPSGPLTPELTTHIPTPLDVSTNPAVVGTNLALAALATLLLTVSSRLLTRMLDQHEEALARRVAVVRLVERLEARLGGAVGGRVRSGRFLDLLRLAGIAVFYGVVFSLLEPGWQPLSSAGAWLFVSFTIACGVVGIADDLVQWQVARRWGLPATLGVRPTNALLAVASTGVSRAASVVPGLMFGAPEALRLDESSLDEARAKRLTTIGFVALVAIGGGSWAATIATTAATRGIQFPIVDGLEALLLLVFASAVQNLFIALLGLSGTAGGLARRRSPVAWAAALLAITFVFWHTLVNPVGDASAALTTRNVQVALGIVVGFTLVVLAAWVILALSAPRAAAPAGPAARAPGVAAAAVPAGWPPAVPGWRPPGGVAAAAWGVPGTVAPTLAAPGTALELSMGTADGRARGRAWFRVAGGWVTTRVELIDPRAATQFRVFAIASAAAWLVPFIGYAASLERGEAPADLAIAGFLLLTVGWLLAIVVGRLLLERYRVAHVVTFPAQAVGGVDLGRDWNVGCLLIVLFPIIGLLYLLLAGGRVVRISAPFAADQPGPVRLRLKGSGIEGRYLEQVLLAARSAA